MFLVTGAAGFLGREIVSLLIQKGEKVHALVLPEDNLASLLPREAEVIRGNLLSKEDLNRFFDTGEEPKILIHCASIITMSMEPVDMVRKVNVEGTQNLIDACLKHGARAMLHVGSVHAITEKPGNEVMAEPERVDPDQVVGYYAITKAMAVQKVMESRRDQGLVASVVYPAGLCGPGDFARGNLSQLFLDYMDGKIPAGVEGGYNFADVRDVAAAIVTLATGELWGEDFVLAGEYIRIMDILSSFSKITGAKKITAKVPIWLARLLMPLMGLYYKIRKIKPIFSAYSLYTVMANSNFSSDKAKALLHYAPRPIAETLEDTARFWMAQKEEKQANPLFHQRILGFSEAEK